MHGWITTCRELTISDRSTYSLIMRSRILLRGRHHKLNVERSPSPSRVTKLHSPEPITAEPKFYSPEMELDGQHNNNGEIDSDGDKIQEISKRTVLATVCVIVLILTSVWLGSWAIKHYHIL